MASLDDSDLSQSSYYKGPHEATEHNDPRSTLPISLEAPISPPNVRSPKRRKTCRDQESPPPDVAAIEAGNSTVDDHLNLLSDQLSQYVRPRKGELLPIDEFKELYLRNQHPYGGHFVVHQHDHPVAGVHYDLRLQISESSSISFAIMYGLPGNPNSRRPNRNATETRVHNLWNHLIETASPHNGSLLIWDIGEYDILPWHTASGPETSSSSQTSSPEHDSVEPFPRLSESEKLHEAFQSHKIRIRLHGHRLPPNYTISFRILPNNNRSTQPKAPARKRRRKGPNNPRATSPPRPSLQSTPDSSSADDNLPSANSEALNGISAQDRELAEAEDERVRLTNAYPGATNSIGSIHRRRWFLSMDRRASGFSPFSAVDGSKTWRRLQRDEEGSGGEITEGKDGGFVVLGKDHERSIVTGRTAEEVMTDGGVNGFVGRRGWRAVVE